MTDLSCKAGGLAAGPCCEGFLRHIRACHNAALPGGRLEFRLAETPVGWLAAETAPAVIAAGAVAAPGALVLREPAALPGFARRLADAGAFRWRGEAFDVRTSAEGPALAQIDRGALPLLGLLGIGVHLNGLVRSGDGLWVWVARRAADKPLDPGKLDHLVGGGVPAGLSPRETLVKEAAEEAGLPAALAAGAAEVGRLRYAMQRAEGLRRDVLVCYDLLLPPDFRPVPADGEVESFQLWPIAAVAEAVRDTDDFKFNVALVLIDLFLRTGVINPASAEGLALRAALAGG
jgi:8-oxo-dGTP pyrophosphatase MutT (NUDIX family)